MYAAHLNGVQNEGNRRNADVKMTREEWLRRQAELKNEIQKSAEPISLNKQKQLLRKVEQLKRSLPDSTQWGCKAAIRVRSFTADACLVESKSVPRNEQEARTQYKKYFDVPAQLAEAVLQLEVRKPRTSGRARQDITAAMIAVIKRDNPEESIERLCQLLAKKRVLLLKSLQDAGFKTWHDAWKDRKFRNRVKRFISGVQPAAPEKS